MKYKIGLDLGSTSLGWSIIEIDENDRPVDFVDMGVRIFSDGRDEKTKQPLCVSRREARISRVRLDRLLMRKKSVLALINNNGMSFKIIDKDSTWDPYFLRAEALKNKISLDKLGRILFHLSLRRGYQSNRNETEEDNEGGKIKSAIDNLYHILKEKGYRTLGEYLYKEKVCKFNMEYDKKSAKENSVYPTRKMYEDEFDAIWDAQAVFYPELLTKDLKLQFFNALFYQRPLKEQSKGFCEFEGVPYARIYKATELFQKFRIFQTLNQLEILQNGENIKLTPEQKSIIKELALYNFSKVNASHKLTFASIKKELNLKKTIKFNLESESRKDFPINTTGYILSSDDFFGKDWFVKTEEERKRIVDMLLSNLPDEQVLNNLRLTKLPKLEKGTGSLSEKAINKILPYLEEGDLYSEACEKAGYHHSKKEFSSLDLLPYYGDIPLIQKSCVSDKNGQYKITNVSVHIALNQLRIVINDLIKKYGKPTAISVELARDLKVGTKGLKDILNKQTQNKKENERIFEFIKKAGVGIDKPSKEDILKVKLWENLSPKNPNDRRCIYTGKQISINDLFGKCEIEHILPFSRTYDDSISNKTVSYIEANRYKTNQTPYEAFYRSNDFTTWDELMQRVENLPDNMKWRFSKNAMEKFNKENGPLARALNDTKYMSKLAVNYLKHICQDPNKVNGLPGQMTALFREQWGLDFYKRKDLPEIYRSSHTHHAIDAFVIACMNQGQLQKISSNANFVESVSHNNLRTQKEVRKLLFKDLDKPFDNFDREAFFERHNNLVISYKPKNKDIKKVLQKNQTIGQLHEDTAYGFRKFTTGTKAIFKVRKRDNDNYVNEFKEKDFTTLVPIFRNTFERDEYITSYKDWYIYEGQSPLNETKENKKIRKEQEEKLLNILKEKAQKAYKWFVSGNIYQTVIFKIRSDDKKYTKDAGKWKMDVQTNFITTITKNTPLWKLKYPTATKIMVLKNNDQIILEIDNRIIVYNVKSIGQNGQFFLRNNKSTQDFKKIKYEEGENSKEKNIYQSFSPYLTELIDKKIRKAIITPLGKLIDPGFKGE